MLSVLQSESPIDKWIATPNYHFWGNRKWGLNISDYRGMRDDEIPIASIMFKLKSDLPPIYFNNIRGLRVENGVFEFLEKRD